MENNSNDAVFAFYTAWSLIYIQKDLPGVKVWPNSQVWDWHGLKDLKQQNQSPLSSHSPKIKTK